MMTQISNPAELLGKVIDSKEAHDYFSSLDSKGAVKRVNGKNRWISKPAGLEVAAEETANRVNAVFMYSHGYDRFHQYSGPIPHGISFAMTRDQVRQTMKTPPSFSDRGGEIYDTWDLPEHRFIVKYEKTGNIARISVTGGF